MNKTRLIRCKINKLIPIEFPLDSSYRIKSTFLELNLISDLIYSFFNFLVFTLYNRCTEIKTFSTTRFMHLVNTTLVTHCSLNYIKPFFFSKNVALGNSDINTNKWSKRKLLYKNTNKYYLEKELTFPEHHLGTVVWWFKWH